jgi:hypothetical protein
MTSPTRSGTRRCTRFAPDIGSGRFAPESPVPSRPVPMNVTHAFNLQSDAGNQQRPTHPARSPMHAGHIGGWACR